ncbi:MAG: DUF1614 domain-containing protein [Candidatus Zixiibacteriota bacterium]
MALIILSVLVYLGLGHRVLDRMRLTDRAALIVIAALILGSFIDIPLGSRVSINVGGALVPVGLAVYLLTGAGTRREVTRALWGAAVTGALLYATGTYLMRGIQEPAGRYAYIEPLYLYPIVAGVVGYLAGRSRRGAFVAATLGVLLGDIFHYLRVAALHAPQRVDIGGGGIFDVTVIAGIFAVLIAEIIGEVRERAQGGPSEEGHPESLLVNLRSPETSGRERSEEYDPKDRH